MGATERSRANLARGPQVRSQRSMLRHRIADGELDVARLVEGDVDEAVEQIALGETIGHLIHSIPGVGDVAYGRILQRAGVVNPIIRLGELTTTRRRRLAGAIREELTQ